MNALQRALLAPFLLFEKLLQKLEQGVLQPPDPGPLRRLAQILVFARRRCVVDHVGDRASALAYSTLLSLLPLMLLSLAGLAALGYPTDTLARVQGWVVRTFLPDVASRLAVVVDRSAEDLAVASRSIGALGLLLLVWAGWSLLATLSRAFRKIWGIHGLLPSLGRMVGFWLTVLLAPILIATSLLVSARLASDSVLAPVLDQALDRCGYLLAALAAYLFLPGRPVKLRAAALGATVSALHFELLKEGLAAYLRHAFVASSVLAGLGALPMFLLWLYFAWVGFLFGAEVAFCAEERERLLTTVSPRPL